MAISCSLWRLKQLPATHQAFRETHRWAAATTSGTKEDWWTVSRPLLICPPAVKVQTIYLRTVLVHVGQVFRQSRQGDVLLQVPQSGGINLHSFNSVGLDPSNLTEQTLCLHTHTQDVVWSDTQQPLHQAPAVCYLGVFSQFKVGSADVCEHPAGVVMLRWQRGENVDRFSAVVGAQRQVATAQLSKHRHHTVWKEKKTCSVSENLST